MREYYLVSVYWLQIRSVICTHLNLKQDMDKDKYFSQTIILHSFTGCYIDMCLNWRYIIIFTSFLDNISIISKLNPNAIYTQACGWWYQGLWFISNYDVKPPWQIFPIDSNVNLPCDDFLYQFFLAILTWKLADNWTFLNFFLPLPQSFWRTLQPLKVQS